MSVTKQFVLNAFPGSFLGKRANYMDDFHYEIFTMKNVK